MSHLDTAFKLGAAQAQHDFQAELHKSAAPVSADFQNQLNALAMAPGEQISRSNAGPTSRQNMGALMQMGAGRFGQGPAAPTAVGGIQRPGTTQPSAALAGMGMGQRGQVANTPTGRGAPQVSPAVAAGPINAPASGGGAVAGLKTPSWARRPA